MSITDILTIKNPEFNLTETISFVTNIAESEDGDEVRDALVDEGLREYKLSVSNVCKDDMDAIWDFYLDRQGAYDDFLIKVATEYNTEDEDVGLADNSETVFLLHNFPVQIDANHSCTVRGVANVDYTLSNDNDNENSYITFNTAPESGGVLSPILVTYEFYLRVRFKNDTLTRKLMSYNLLNAGLEFVEVRWNTYFGLSGRSSSSSSSSSATMSTFWHSVYGQNAEGGGNLYGILEWDGTTLIHQNALYEAGLPGSCTVNDCLFATMNVWMSAPPGMGKYRKYTLYKENEPTGLTITIKDLSTSGFVTFQIPCNAGESLVLREDRFGSPSKISFSIGFTYWTGHAGRQMIPGGMTRAWSSCYPFGSAINYWPYTFTAWWEDSSPPNYHLSGIISTPGYFGNLYGKASHVVFRNSAIGWPDPGDDNYGTEGITLYKANSESSYGINTELRAEVTGLEVGARDVAVYNATYDQDLFVYERAEVGSMYQFRADYWYSWISKFAIDFYPDTPKHGLFGCNTFPQQYWSPTHIDETLYSPIHGAMFLQPLSEREETFTLFAMGGTLTNWIIRSDLGVVAGFPLVATLRKNGADTKLTFTFTNIITEVNSTCNVRVEQGDRMSIKLHSDRNPAGVGDYGFNVGYTFIPDNGGEWPLFYTFNYWP